MNGLRISLLTLLSMIFAVPTQARPLYDFIAGGAMLIVGGAFELQRSDQKDKAEVAQKKGLEHLTLAVTADEQFFYFAGAADWELLNFGATAQWTILANEALAWQAISIAESDKSVQFSNSFGSHRNKQKLYKGVSLASFGVGSALIIKGAITLYLDKRAQQVASRVDIVPQRTGGLLVYNHKW